MIATSPAAEPPSRLTGPRVFGVSFLVLLAVLLVRSRELFSRVIYEEGDLAANSIIIYHAKHFDLLVGNYSRIGFSHPGPAYFYVQAAGEWLLHDLAHLVPSPWNGQAIAILALNAACVASTLTVLFSWFRSAAAVAAAAGVAAGYLAAHGQLVTSTWMPYAYFAPFLLLLVTAAAVAAGRTRHLWLLAFAGSLLVHGHAEFLFFVPLLAGAALLVHWRRRGPGAKTRRDWLVALGVLAVFALPIVLNLALHWPGEFGKYLTYGGGRGVHPPGEVLRYQLQFWTANPYLALAVVVIAFAGVRLLAHLARDEPYGRLLLGGWRMVGLATLLFFGYASYGIDALHETYVGYFSQAMPLALMMLGAAGAVALLPGSSPDSGRLTTPVPGRLAWDAAEPERALGSAPLRPLAARGAAAFGARPAVARIVGAAALTVGLVAACLSGELVNRRGEVPNVPVALDAMAARAAGRPMVLELSTHDAWPEATPLVVGGLRRGHRVCLRDPIWRVLITEEFVCTAADLATGERFVVGRPDHLPSGATVLADVSPSVVAAAR